MKKRFSALGNAAVWTLNIIGIIFILWFILSWIDVNLHNGYAGDGPQLNPNFFNVLIELMER